MYISTRRAKYAFFTSEESYRTIYRLTEFLKHVSVADSEGPVAKNSDSASLLLWALVLSSPLLFSSPLPPSLTFSSFFLFCWFYLPSKATFSLPPSGPTVLLSPVDSYRSSTLSSVSPLPRMLLLAQQPAGFFPNFCIAPFLTTSDLPSKPSSRRGPSWPPFQSFSWP